jgi:alkylresorcinol/alkylpyrone synthase
MRIAGVASAFPRQYFSQQEITSALKQHWADKLGNPDVLDRLLSRVGVESRHLALPIEAYDGLTSWGKANDAWIEVSEELAEQALCKALTRAGLSVKDLGAIFFVSGKTKELDPVAPPDRGDLGRRSGPSRLTAHDNSQQAGVTHEGDRS